MAGESLRHRLYRALDPEAREGQGLSVINRLLVLLIIAASIQAVAETEPTIIQGREQVFRAAELVIVTIFSVEYLARLWIAPENPDCARHRWPRLHYVFTPAAIIDLLAIVPTLLSFGITSSLFLRLFRVLRILRLAKLGRMSSAWDDLMTAVHSRRHELLLTVMLAGVAILISSTLLYLVEGGIQPEKFGSIPRSFWWSVVTLTTVGYGDVFPVTPVGKMLGGLVAITGIGIIALPTGILAGAFSDVLQQRRAREAKAQQDLERRE
jgi:voltage-gated potassium channel